MAKVENGRRTVLGSGLPVPPANIGPRSTPNYEQLASAAVAGLSDGSKVFAGPRDDPFFVDLGSVFDLAGLRPFNQAHLIPRPTEAGVDGVSGYNTHSIVLQVPIKQLTGDKKALTGADDPDSVIGVYAASWRRQTKVLSPSGNDPLSLGKWVQVSRLGMPLVNEVVIPLGQEGPLQRLRAGRRRPVRQVRPRPRGGPADPGAVPGGQGAGGAAQRHRHHLPDRHPRAQPAQEREAVGDDPAQHGHRAQQATPARWGSWAATTPGSRTAAGSPTTPPTSSCARWPGAPRSRPTSTSRPTTSWATA